MDYLDADLLSGEYLDDILIITKNKNQEIMTVDFNLEQAYIVLSEITRRLQENLGELEKGKIYGLFFSGTSIYLQLSSSSLRPLY